MRRLVAGMIAGVAAVAAMVGVSSASWAQAEVKSATLDAVKKRGQLICGVDEVQFLGSSNEVFYMAELHRRFCSNLINRSLV